MTCNFIPEVILSLPLRAFDIAEGMDVNIFLVWFFKKKKKTKIKIQQSGIQQRDEQRGQNRFNHRESKINRHYQTRFNINESQPSQRDSA